MEGLAEEFTPSAALAFFERYQRGLRREYDIEPSEELVAFTRGGCAIFPRGRRPGCRRSPPTRSRCQRSSMRRPDRGLGRTGRDRGIGSSRGGIPSRPDRDARALQGVGGAGAAEAGAGTAPGGTWLSLREWCRLRAARLSLSDGGGTVAEVTLLECDGGARLFRERFGLGEGRWIAVLNDICWQIGARLQIAVLPRRACGERRPAAPTSFGRPISGSKATSSRLRRRETDQRAQALFERAISLDPQLACGYSSLAGILHTRTASSFRAGRRSRATASAPWSWRAVELDRMDCRNHVILGWAHTLARRYDSADFTFQLAVDLAESVEPQRGDLGGLGRGLRGAHDHASAMATRAFAALLKGADACPRLVFRLPGPDRFRHRRSARLRRGRYPRPRRAAIDPDVGGRGPGAARRPRRRPAGTGALPRRDHPAAGPGRRRPQRPRSTTICAASTAFVASRTAGCWSRACRPPPPTAGVAEAYLQFFRI